MFSELVVENKTEIKSNKKLLLLVHPDIVFEMDFNVAQRYYKAIEDDIGRFDYVIVHLFYSDQILQIAPRWGWGDNKLNLLKNFLKLLKRDANVVLHDQNYSASFKEELPYYLIDNPGTTVYFAGGYKDLCVKLTQEKMEEILGDIIFSTQTKTACYKPLTLNARNESNWMHLSENNSFINEKTIISRFNELFDYYKSLNVYAKDQILGIVADDLRQEFEKFLVKGETSGSTRIVFIFDDVVIKIAPLTYGTINNKKEVENATCLGDLAPKIIDYDKENYYWLVMEKVENNLGKVKILAMKLFPNLIKFDLFSEPFEPANAHQDAFDDNYGIQKISHPYFNDSAYQRLMAGASEEGKEWLNSFKGGVERCKFDTYDLFDFN